MFEEVRENREPSLDIIRGRQRAQIQQWERFEAKEMPLGVSRGFW